MQIKINGNQIQKCRVWSGIIVATNQNEACKKFCGYEGYYFSLIGQEGI